MKRVWSDGAVAAAGRFGAIVTDVLTDTIPQVLRGQRSAHGHGKHGEENDRLHSHRQAFDARRRPHEAAVRFSRFLRRAAVSRLLLRRCEHIVLDDLHRVRLVHVNKPTSLTHFLFVLRTEQVNTAGYIDFSAVVATTMSQIS